MQFARFRREMYLRVFILVKHRLSITNTKPLINSTGEVVIISIVPYWNREKIIVTISAKKHKFCSGQTKKFLERKFLTAKEFAFYIKEFIIKARLWFLRSKAIFTTYFIRDSSSILYETEFSEFINFVKDILKALVIPYICCLNRIATYQ